MTTEQKKSRAHTCGRLNEAEGLIELITRPASKLGLSRRLRRRIAARALRTALPLDRDRVDAWRRDLVIGQSLRLSGRHRLALGPLWTAVQRNPEARAAWIALGWCLKRVGRVDRAAQVMAQAISRIPDDATLHFNLACYLAQLGQTDMAISQLLWAFDLRPELRARLAGERDFDPIRGSASFQAICATA